MKIAILLSGRIIGYEESYKNIMDKLVRDNDVDFYVGVSNEKVNTDLEKGFKELFKPVSYKKTTKGELSGINWDKVKTNNYMEPMKKNIMFMWKNRLNLLNQLKNSKKKYDWIISTRVDERYPRKLNYDKLSRDKLNIPDNSTSDWEGIQDQIAIGKRPLIEKYLSVYSNLKKYISDVGKHKHLKNFDAEKIMKHHLIIKNIPVNRFKYQFKLSRVGNESKEKRRADAQKSKGFKTD